MIWYIVLRVRYTDVCIISLMQKNNDQKIGMDINEYVWNSSYELKSRTVKKDMLLQDVPDMFTAVS